MIVDFHSHTYESDGTLSPDELCAAMHKRGVAVFSITDHDTLGAYRGLSVPAPMRLVVGIEINTTYNGNEAHVLGYNLPLSDGTPLEKMLQANRSARRERIGEMVTKLQAAGYGITMDQVLAEAGKGQSLGRPHVGKALIRHGHVTDIETAFRSLLVRGKPGYVPSTHITPHEAIAAIQAAGGISVLAHPGRLHDYSMIDELVEHGLQGLEVFYPTHEAAQVQLFRDVATKHGLLMSGGSDFHDIRYHKRGVGMEIDEADIKPFLNAVA
ncbi:MAG: PHP domain-containing protein [Candidatus Eremiobacteraeota bacterium]|nr:PHP domain-containing protein [Candidatus Eremiobacteraeota bacterium]